METFTFLNDSDCLSADDQFGPRVKAQCRNFDFTVEFEQSIFSILPSSLFILCAAARIVHLYHARYRVSATSLRWVKQSLGAILGILQLCLLVLSITLGSNSRPSSIASLSLSVADVLLICVLSHLEHTKTIRPSSLLLTYLSTSVLLDATSLRTLWLLKSEKLVLKIVSSSSLAVKLALLTVESSRKAKYFINKEDKTRSPEETGGIFSNGLFSWLLPFLWTGFKNVLTLSDLNQLPKSCTVTNMESQFTQIFEKEKAHRHSLVRTILKSFWHRLMCPVIPRLCVLTFTLLQPILMLKLLRWLEDTSAEDLGYGILGGYGIIYIGLAIATGAYWRFQLQFITLLRGVLLSAVFQKTLSIHPMDAKKTPVSLVSTDIEMACTGLDQLHELYSSLLQIGIGTWLLEQQVGVACIAPMIVAAVCAVATYKISQRVGICQKGWLESVQTRLNATTSMLSNMKIIQMSGLGRPIFDMIFKFRDAELDSAKSYRGLLVWVMGLAYAPSAISPVITLVIYAATQHNIWDSSSTARIFTALSLIGLVTSPLAAVFQQIPAIIAAFSCVNRVENFLKQPNMTDRKAIMDRESETQLTMGPEKQPIALSIPLVEYQSNSKPHFAFTSHNATFSYPGSSFPTLQSLTINIPWSKVTLVMGPTGSGKSALVKAILGELNISQGVSTRGFDCCAYCDQTPWIGNQSIRANIAGHLEDYQKRLYDETVWACELERDLESMLEHDLTNVGSGGATLSGGQKQRISLARAAYSQQKVIMLDDSFCALDSRTEQTVVRRLLGPNGLMRSNDQTVVITSSTDRLVPYADFLIILDDNGALKAHGPMRQMSHLLPDSLSAVEEEKFEPTLEGTSPLEPVASKELSTQSKSNDLEISSAKGSPYRSYFKSMGLCKGLTLGALLTLQTFFSKFPTVWLQWWLDGNSQEMGRLYARYIGIYSVFQALGLSFTLVAAFQQFRVTMPHASRYFHTRLLSAVMSLPFPCFSIMSTGSIANRFSQDLQLVDWTLPLTFLNASEGALGTLAQVLIISSASPYLLIAFPFIFATVIAVQRFYLRTSRQLRSMDIEAKSPLLNHFLETIDGLQTIRAFGWQHRTQAVYQSHLSASQRPYYQRFMLQRWLTLVLDMIAAGLAVLVVGTAIALRTRSALIGLALVNVISLSESLQLLVLQWAVMEISLGSISRLEAFNHHAMAAQSEASSKDSLTTLPQSQSSWPTQGHIEITHLTARYTADGPAALQDISFTIPPGTKLGICGRTGSGKSTLLATLFGMVSVTDGTVTIDGLNLAHLHPDTLRAALIGIAQESYIVPGLTVRENLLLGCQRQQQDLCDDDIQLIDALQTVQLWDAIEERGGLSAVLDDQSQSLSAGQSQLFACARALLRTGSVVVLDEPTSHLTVETTKVVRRVITDNFRERTVIVVMHDIQSILDLDLVVVLEEGRVVQMGTPEELREQDGIFRTMLDST